MIHTIDVSSVITIDDISEALLELNYIFDNDLTCKNFEAAPNQTYPTLFESTSKCFVNIKNSFIYACSKGTNSNLKNRHASAWAYRAKGRISKEERNSHWHVHSSPGIEVSGVLCLKANFNEIRSGTEFFLYTQSFNIKPKPLTWVLFPPLVRHRPGFNFFGDTRLSIAADLYKESFAPVPRTNVSSQLNDDL